MGNVESGPEEGPLGPVGSLGHRLQSLEETIRSIEVGRRNSESWSMDTDIKADIPKDRRSTGHGRSERDGGATVQYQPTHD